MDHTIALPLSVFTLMLVAMGVFLLAKKVRVPYTVLLVFAGIVLVPLAQTPVFSYITTFHLTPELLFFIFLPVLLFEAAYNMSLRRVAREMPAVTLLAVGGLLLAAFGTAVLMHGILGVIGVDVPLLALLLFGALIAATDPVAVLALFKEYGAPRRLALLFEGESLFNDGTAVALFLVVLGVIQSGASLSAATLHGVAIFLMMIFGGALFGIIMGVLFSKALQYTDQPHVHITLTMLVAHLTFLLAEMITRANIGVHLSPIIATVMAALVVGNYGRYKLSPRTEEYMQQFWDYFAFVANALVFLLMGLIFAQIDVTLRELVVPLFVAIIVVMVMRAVSIYGTLLPFNALASSERRVPWAWQHLLAWGSLRGALAVIMALMVPADLTVPGWTLTMSPRDFILALTIGCIYFTLFIKATTIPAVMRRLRIDALRPLEEVEYWEGRAQLYATALTQLAALQDRDCASAATRSRMERRLRAQYDDAVKSLRTYTTTDAPLLRRALKLYAIGVERRTLKMLYASGEISEWGYKKALGKLAIQRAHVEEGGNDRVQFEHICAGDVIERILAFVRRMMFLPVRRKTARDKFLYYRALMILAREVVAHLKRLAAHAAEAQLRGAAFADVLATYETFARQSERKMRAVMAQHPALAAEHEAMVCREVLRVEEDTLDELMRTEMITPKLHAVLRTEIRKEIL